MQPSSTSKLSVALVLALLVWTGCDTESIPSSGVEEPEPEATAGKRGKLKIGKQYVVVLNETAVPDRAVEARRRAAEAARSLRLRPVHSYGAALVGFSAKIPPGRLNALRRNPAVAYVEPVKELSIPRPKAVGLLCSLLGLCDNEGQITPWGIHRTGAADHAGDAAGVHVFVIDTGIDSDHRDLQAHVGSGFAATPCLGLDCREDWDDDHGHGTHVAGTIGALQNDVDVVGMAPGVTLHAVKVMNAAGTGTSADVIAGIDWVTERTAALNAATVANMSLGGVGEKTGDCTGGDFVGADAYHAALCNAKNAGVVFAIAAGNDGADAEGTVPAAYDDAVITVSATTCDVNGQQCASGSDDWTSWSNWGDESASWTSFSSAPVAVAAPGDGILSTKYGGGTTTMSGTSMASPHLAGAAALALAAHPQAADGSAFTNIRNLLLETAEETTSWRNTSGNPHQEPFVDVRSFSANAEQTAIR